MTQEAIQEIIRKQRNYFYTSATLNIDFRITALKKLQTSIQSHQEQINAALKSEYVIGKYGVDCVAYDTGLEVEALNGAPGIYSARYAGGEGHDSEANMKKLLHEMEGQDNRRAQFRTAICLIEGGKEHLFEGVVRGEIIRHRRGTSGFGYDPVFVPEGYTETFAEMGNEEKNKISHRARAVQKLCAYLKK